MKKIEENVMKSDIKPYFADDVIVVTPIKAIKEGKKIRKEGHVVFIFADMLSQQPIAKIAVSKTTAESLKNVLSKVLAKMDKDLKSRDMPQPEVLKTDTTKYIE
jgi:hypothetical protein